MLFMTLCDDFQAGIAERDAEVGDDSAERTPLLRLSPQSTSSSQQAMDQPIVGSKLVRKANETARNPNPNIPRSSRYRDADQVKPSGIN